MRPAWSFSWLRGEPAFHLAMTGPAGTLAGTVWPASGLAFAGRARAIQLSLLPLDHLVEPLPVLGRVDAEIDLRTGPNGPTGEIRFEAWDGSIALGGDYIYLATGGNLLRARESDDAKAELVSQGGWHGHIAIEGDHIYLANGADLLRRELSALCGRSA